MEISNDLRIPFPKVGFNPPVYYCKKTSEKPVLDGDLNKEFWSDAPFTDLFEDIEGSSMPAPRYNTRAKMKWTDNALYIGAILYGDEIWAHLKERDCVIFYDNDFEIFIDPNSDTQEYLEYEMNALGTYWDLLLTKAYRDMGSPVNAMDIKGLQNAVKICGKLNTPDESNKYWSVEVMIPFTTPAECADSRKAPVPGEFYRVNFSRVQWKVDKENGTYTKLTDDNGKALPEDNWVWSPTGVINIHYPELWGFVFFCDDKVTDPEIPETERIKWELRKIYYAENALLDTEGCYTDNKSIIEDVIKDGMCIDSEKKINLEGYELYTTPSYFEASSYTKDKNQKVSIFADGKTTVTPANKE